MPEYQTLKLKDVKVDYSIQPRVNGLNQDHVDDLEAAYKAGDVVPPPVAWFLPDETYQLSQGFHRFEGARRAGKMALKFLIRTGSYEQCAIDALTSNRDHGLKRTNADKRRCVEQLLKLLPKESDRAIAEKAGVSDSFVGDTRRHVQSDCTSPPPTTRTGRDGKEYPIPEARTTAPTPGPIVCKPVGEGLLADIRGITADDAVNLAAVGLQTLAGLEQQLESLRAERGRQNATIYDVLRSYSGLFDAAEATRIGDAILDHLNPKPPAAPEPNRRPTSSTGRPASASTPPTAPPAPPADTIICPHCLGAGRIPKPPPVPTLYDAPGMPPIPDALDTVEFLIAWEEWLNERRAKRNKVTPKAAVKQLRDLEAHGPKVAVQAIELSIKNGWTGLFPGKVNDDRKSDKRNGGGRGTVRVTGAPGDFDNCAPSL